MPDTAMKKMHLPLPPDMHARLREEAAASGTPTTVLARKAVAEWLERRRRERVSEEIRSYAEKMAGIEAWLDHDR